MHIVISPLCSSAVTSACCNHIRDYAAHTPSVKTNNTHRGSYFVNRWLSPKNLHNSTNQYLSSLLGEILSASSRFSSYLIGNQLDNLCFNSCWSMISFSGFTGEPHRHAGLISGVFYLDAGDSSGDEGALILYASNGEILTKFTPSSGDLVLFPSSQIHSVSAYQSSAERVVLSFNMD